MVKSQENRKKISSMYFQTAAFLLAKNGCYVINTFKMLK